MRSILLMSFLLLCVTLSGQSADSTAIRQVDSLILEVRSLIGTGDFKEAIAVIETAENLAITRIGQESVSYANALANHARIYYFQSENSQAEQYYLRAKDIRARIVGKEHPDYGWSMNQLGTLYLQTGDLKKAEGHFLEAKRIWGNALGKKHAWYGGVVNNLGNVHKEMGEFDLAEADYLESKDIRAESPGKQSADYAWSLNNLANLYQDMGNYEAAEPLYLEALTIRETLMGKNSLDYEGGLQGLGNLYILKGDFEKAEYYHLEAKAILENHFGKDHRDYTFSLNNLSSLYARMGDFKKAEKLDLEVLEIREKKVGKESSDYAVSLNSVAAHYTNSKQYDKAEPLYREAMAIDEKNVGREHPDYALGQYNLGVLYKATKRYQEAIKQFSEASATQAKSLGEKHPDYLETQWSLANTLRAAKQYDEADALYERMLPVIRQVYSTDHPFYIQVLKDLGEKELEAGHKLDACRFFEQEAQFERKQLSLAVRHLSEQQLSAYLIKFIDQLEFRTDVASSGSKELTGACYDDILFYKGFLLQASSRLRKLASSNIQTTNTYNRLTACYRQLADEFAYPSNEQQKAIQLQAQADSLEKVLARTISGFSDAQIQVTWKQVQQKLAPAEAAVEFVRYRHSNADQSNTVRYAALLIRPDGVGPEFIPLCDEKQLEKLLLLENGNRPEYLNDLYNGNRSKSLYEWVWKPLEPRLVGIKTVAIAPIGLLHRINLAAIPVSQEEVLANRFEVLLMGSTRQLVAGNETKAPEMDATVYGGIYFDALSPAEYDSTTIGMQRGIDLSLTDLWGTKQFPQWQYLKWTAIEAEAIAGILKEAGYQVTVFQKNQATEASLKSVCNPTKSPGILHLATHGFFFDDPILSGASDKTEGPVFKWSEHPMVRSGLIMSGGNEAWLNRRTSNNREDGILTAYEISQMDLRNTELVVLSACETGLGEIRDSEGVYGLQRAFKIAGAKYLIMSLWQTSDFHTQELMTAFYANWMERKMSIPAAFDAAQKAMKIKYRDPFYWAGFILVE